MIRARAGLASVVLVTAMTTGLGAELTATAAPDYRSEPVARPATGKVVGLYCPTNVVGVLPNRKLVDRFVNQREVIESDSTARPVPYIVTAMALSTYSAATSAVAIRVVARDGRPRMLTANYHNASNIMSFKSTTMLNKRFRPRLFAGSGGKLVYAVNGGVLRRWVSRADARGRLYYGRPLVIRRDVRNFKTFSYFGREKLGRLRTDVLWATTRSGSLVQVRVPVKKPRKDRVIVAKQTGFADVTGLSLSWCEDSRSYLSFVATYGRANKAKWFTVRKQWNPKPHNVVDRGRVGIGFNWRLHATF